MMVDNYYKINMLEKKLLEEVARYKAINKYGQKMILEQDAPPAPDAAGDVPPPPPAGGDTSGLDVPPPPPPADDTAAGGLDTPPPPAGDAGADDTTGGDTEEVDVTDLVDMVKNLKKDFEDYKNKYN